MSELKKARAEAMGLYKNDPALIARQRVVIKRAADAPAAADQQLQDAATAAKGLFRLEDLRDLAPVKKIVALASTLQAERDAVIKRHNDEVAAHQATKANLSAIVIALKAAAKREADWRAKEARWKELPEVRARLRTEALDRRKSLAARLEQDLAALDREIAELRE